MLRAFFKVQEKYASIEIYIYGTALRCWALFFIKVCKCPNTLMKERIECYNLITLTDANEDTLREMSSWQVILTILDRKCTCSAFRYLLVCRNFQCKFQVFPVFLIENSQNYCRNFTRV